MALDLDMTTCVSHPDCTWHMGFEIVLTAPELQVQRDIVSQTAALQWFICLQKGSKNTMS